MRCDIIIPVWNHAALTKNCVDSILKNTSADYRIVIIDNASDEETAGYLDGLTAAYGPKISVIRNEKNVGFIKAVNQGIKSSDAPYVCLLNNDTLVASGWLETMLRVAESSPDVGIVNPSSNNLDQRPAKGESIDVFAEKLLREEGDNLYELGSAIGFCMLIKREVIRKIGLFDEIYGMGNFEDSDFSKRAAKAGYRCVRACGAYVYHLENASFNKRKTFNDDFQHNKKIFETRWGRSKRVAYVFENCGADTLNRFRSEALGLAKGGDQVWYFSKDTAGMPVHSNIILKNIPGKRFYIKVMFTILKKKKKFAEIFVDKENFGKVLKALSFIHRARVSYY